MDVLNCIYKAIDEMNEELEEGSKLEKSENAEIFGANSMLDSMGLVNLITIIEQIIEEETGNFISIADEKAMSMEVSPFRNVKVLKQYIETLV